MYWCPCFGKDGYLTLFVADQAAVVGACRPKVQNYFVYALSKSKAEPIGFLDTGPHPVPGGGRNMWCTAPLFHAAGRGIYQRGPGDFVALSPAEAARRPDGRRSEGFEFVPLRIALSRPEAGHAANRLGGEVAEAQRHVFHITDAR